MGALCTNNKEIHEKLKFLQLGKDVVRQRILLNFDVFLLINLFLLISYCSINVFCVSIIISINWRGHAHQNWRARI